MLRASCPTHCSNGLWNSTNGWKTHNLLGKPGSVLSCQSISCCSEGTSCVSHCAHCLWFCHWASVERAQLHLPGTIPWDVYRHWWDSSELCLLQAEEPQLFRYFLKGRMLQSLQLCDTLLVSSIFISLLFWRTGSNTPSVASPVLITLAQTL